jgi:hypothetical protein
LKFKYLFIYDVCHMTEAYCCGFSFVWNIIFVNYKNYS